MPETGDTDTQSFGPSQGLLMGWVRVSDDFYDHEKFAHVSVLGDAVWIRGLAYANRNLTDGFISERAARGLVDVAGLGKYQGNYGGRDVEPQDGIDELLAADLWHGPGHDCPVCPQPALRMYVIHDYLVYQPSKADVQEKREATADRVRKHRSSRRNAVTAPVTEAVGNAASTTPPKSQVPTPLTTSKDPSSPIGGAGETEDGLEARSKRFGFDGQRIRRELTKLLDEFPDDDSVMRVATTILKKAAGWPNDPTGYVITSIKNDVFTAKQLAYGGAA